MRYSVEFNDGLGWHLVQSNIGNKTTAKQIILALGGEYPDYKFRMVENELIEF